MKCNITKSIQFLLFISLIIFSYITYDKIYPATISEEQHQENLALADKSIDDYTRYTSKKCNHIPVSQQQMCLKKASKEWLSERGHYYKRLPTDTYITGRGIAETAING